MGDHGSWEVYGWVIMDPERYMDGWSWIYRGLWMGDQGSWEVYGWVIMDPERSIDGWSWILRGIWMGDHGFIEVYGWVITDPERSMDGWSWILRGLWVGDCGSWEVYGWVIMDLERSIGSWSWILRGLWVGDRGSWEVYGWVIVAKLPISLTLSSGGSRIYQKITPTKEVCAQPTNQIWQIACKKLHSMTKEGSLLRRPPWIYQCRFKVYSQKHNSACYKRDYSSILKMYLNVMR